MEKSISFSSIEQAVHEAYDMFKDNQDGKNADYIPYLANVDKNLFGISVCLLDGRMIEVGDTRYRFGIESVSKVYTAILVLRQYGAEKLLSMIGADATGLPFNSIIAILLENDHPSPPLVNAGAITACSKTGRSVFDASFSPQITSLIATVGFYEHTGDWLYTSGIPAKTGVGGGVMGVLPGIMGISAFAPPIDESGNSVKAQLAIKHIMNKLGLSVFSGDSVKIIA